MADAQTELNVLENKLQAQLESAHRIRNTNIIVGIVLIVIVLASFLPKNCENPRNDIK